MDRFAENLWDVQSKGAKNNSPAAIGKELVTLFKNYLSDLDFREYILFLGGVSSTVRINDSLNVFDIKNELIHVISHILHTLWVYLLNSN